MYLMLPGQPTDIGLHLGKLGLLSLQQVRVEGECYYFLFLNFHSFSSFTPVSHFQLLYFLFYLFSAFLWETTKVTPKG